MHSCIASAMMQVQQNKVCFETDRQPERRTVEDAPRAVPNEPSVRQRLGVPWHDERQRRPTYVQVVTITPQRWTNRFDDNAGRRVRQIWQLRWLGADAAVLVRPSRRKRGCSKSANGSQQHSSDPADSDA